MGHQSAIFENSWPPVCQIWINFTHLKLWIASARHNFKWAKFKLNNLAVKGISFLFSSHIFTSTALHGRTCLIICLRPTLEPIKYAVTRRCIPECHRPINHFFTWTIMFITPNHNNCHGWCHCGDSTSIPTSWPWCIMYYDRHTNLVN